MHSLAAKLLFKRPVPGWHGKGGYSGQGRLVLANNGEEPAGIGQPLQAVRLLHRSGTQEPRGRRIAEPSGTAQHWRLIERRQFTDVTGPGGILGPPDDDGAAVGRRLGPPLACC